MFKMRIIHESANPIPTVRHNRHNQHNRVENVENVDYSRSCNIKIARIAFAL